MTDQEARDEREGLARALYEDEQSRRHPTTPFRWDMAGIERDEYLRRADAVRGWLAEAGYRKRPEPEWGAARSHWQVIRGAQTDMLNGRPDMDALEEIALSSAGLDELLGAAGPWVPVGEGER